MPLKIAALDEPQLNLTPMIDVVFNLIIFFMVGTRFADLERQFDVQLPRVSAAQPLTNLPDEIVVNVYRDGRVVVNRDPMTIAQLETTLRAARERYADQAVLVRGDGQGIYQSVIDVLGACQRAGIRHFSLAAQFQPE
jgi:biopolymer transport protein ExbD